MGQSEKSAFTNLPAFDGLALMGLERGEGCPRPEPKPRAFRPTCGYATCSSFSEPLTSRDSWDPETPRAGGRGPWCCGSEVEETPRAAGRGARPGGVLGDGSLVGCSFSRVKGNGKVLGISQGLQR